MTLSDPLLFRVERPDSLPSSLADAVGVALGSARVRPGERVGVLWETYGLVSHPEPFRVTLTVTREGETLLAAGRMLDPVARIAQGAGDILRGVVVVFEQQNLTAIASFHAPHRSYRRDPATFKPS